MTAEERLLTGIAVGMAVWLITRAGLFFLTRSRLQAGLRTDIELLAAEVAESNEYIEEWISTLRPEKRIEYSVNHTSCEQDLFKSVVSKVPVYFSTQDFTKVLRFYKSIEEYEILLGGFFRDVSVWKDEKRQLSGDDISYLSKKADRVIALGKILASAETGQLKSLPSDYSAKVPAKNIVTVAESS